MPSHQIEVRMEAINALLAKFPTNSTWKGLSNHEIGLVALPVCLWSMHAGDAARVVAHISKDDNGANTFTPIIALLAVQNLIGTWNINTVPPLPTYQQSNDRFAVRIAVLNVDVSPANRPKFDNLCSEDWQFRDSEDSYQKNAPVFAFLNANDDGVHYVPLPSNLMPQFVDGSGRLVMKSEASVPGGGDWAALMVTLVVATDLHEKGKAVSRNVNALTLYARAKIFQNRVSTQAYVAWLQHYPASSTSTDFTLEYDRVEASKRSPELLFSTISPVLRNAMLEYFDTTVAGKNYDEAKVRCQNSWGD